MKFAKKGNLTSNSMLADKITSNLPALMLCTKPTSWSSSGCTFAHDSIGFMSFNFHDLLYCCLYYYSIYIVEKKNNIAVGSMLLLCRTLFRRSISIKLVHTFILIYTHIYYSLGRWYKQDDSCLKYDIKLLFYNVFFKKHSSMFNIIVENKSC